MQVHWAHRFFLFLFLLAIRTEAVIFVAARPGLCRRSGEGQKARTGSEQGVAIPPIRRSRLFCALTPLIQPRCRFFSEAAGRLSKQLADITGSS